MAIKQGDKAYRMIDGKPGEIGIVRHIINGIAVLKYPDRKEKVQLEELIKYEPPVEKKVTAKDFDEAVQAYKFVLTVDAGPRADIGEFLDVIDGIAAGIRTKLFD